MPLSTRCSPTTEELRENVEATTESSRTTVAAPSIPIGNTPV